MANSLRAAILTGEFKPGDQLPSGHDLSKFFGVARMTVQQSIRVLREEGFVTSQAGSGVFVRDHPGARDDGTKNELAGVATFLHEMGFLKHLPRAGWLMLGITQPESVAEHTFRVAITGVVLAALKGADVGRTASLCLMHDSPESRIGDIPSVGRAYISTMKAEAISSHQTSTMPDSAGTVIRELVQEYEAEESIEAQLAHDADKIETLLQAREYQTQGQFNTEPWQESSLAALKTDVGRQLARAVEASHPEEWWSGFAQSYRELRRSSRGSRNSNP
ncbi:MAG: HD domain-containing protein [Acidimicrobiaceae bacterium]|nr:HD domain-containing protein [Acidimicrobiaceae bacterium]